MVECEKCGMYGIGSIQLKKGNKKLKNCPYCGINEGGVFSIVRKKVKSQNYPRYVKFHDSARVINTNSPTKYPKMDETN